MIKPNGYLQKTVNFLKLTQSSSFKYLSDLDWVSFEKLTGFQGSHFVCGCVGGMLVVGDMCE